MLSISVIDYIRQQAFEQVELRSGQFGNWLQRWCLLVPSYGFTRWFLRAIIWIPFNTAEHRTYGKLEQWWLFEGFKANYGLFFIFRSKMWHFHLNWCKMSVFQSQKPDLKTLSTWIWNQPYVFSTAFSPNIEMLPKTIAFDMKTKKKVEAAYVR